MGRFYLRFCHIDETKKRHVLTFENSRNMTLSFNRKKRNFKTRLPKVFMHIIKNARADTISTL